MTIDAGIPAAALSALLATGCASTPAGTGSGVSLSGCISQSRISSFEALDPSRMLVYGPGRQEGYLAELGAGCLAMDQRATLSFVDGDRNGNICGFGGDAVAYRDGPRLAQCRILSLTRLAPAALEQVEVAHGLRKEPPGGADQGGP